MTQKHFVYPYGRAHKEFDMEEGRIIKEIVAAEMPVIPEEELKARILDAIYHPIGSAPINELVKPGMKIAFICNDSTRVANTFDFMPVLVDEMNKLGIKDEDMRIVFSLGSHREMSREEMAEQVSAGVANRLAMYNSNCKIPEDFNYFGQTSHDTPVLINKLVCDVDLVILTGSIVHHYFSGFGGGRKAILPGVSALETIRVNHSLMLEPNVGLGILHGNPVYDDQVEGVRLFAKKHKMFLFNAVLNAEHQFLKIFAGDWYEAHLVACEYVDKVYGVEIKEPADLVIASACGYPKDINMYQLQKTMDNAYCAVKAGGVVIILGECEEGSGSAVLEETCRKAQSIAEIRDNLRKNFRIGANKAFAITRLMEKAKFILVSALPKDMAKDMFFTACVDDVDQAIAEAEKYLPADYKVVLMPQGGLTVPLIKK